MSDPGEVTRILHAVKEGDSEALERLAPAVYSELRRMASRQLRNEAPDRTLQTTDLVHEAWMRLAAADLGFESRAHFLRVAARMMRRILVDHARARRSVKRGEGRPRVALDEMLEAYEEKSQDLLGLDEALKRLDGRDPVKTQIVELRFFGGLSMSEVADVMGLSLATAERQWSAARTWLAHAMGRT